MKSKKKKLSVIQVSRVLVQVIFFILLPGLYASTFQGLKEIYLAILSNSFQFTKYLVQMIEIVAVFPVTILLGRFFCGWMCAFGSMGDLIFYLGEKTRKKSILVPENVDRAGKSLKYILLVALMGFFWTQNPIDLSSSNPWDAFGVLATVTKIPDLAYAWKYFSIGVILLLLIMIGSFFIERFFCRYLCPLGAIFAIVSWLRIVKIKKPSKDCGSCRLCTKKCSMGIPMYKKDVISSGECIHCMKCVQVCPRNNVHTVVSNQEMQPILVGTFAAAAITGTYYVTTYASDSITSNSVTATASDSPATQSKYADGVYEGSGTGFRGGTTKVSVTIKSGVITGVEILSYEDDAPYFNRAYKSAVSQIISTQSTEVDAVSGATYSSHGIMEAVANALSQAGNNNTSSSQTVVAENSETSSNFSSSSTSSSSTNPQTSSISSEQAIANKNEVEDEEEADLDDDDNTTTGNSTANSTTSTTTQSNVAYTDGTYKGSGTGFRGGTTKVSVTVKGGAITGVEVLSYEDDTPYFNRAYKSIVSQMISTQSANVDAVSGATYSSNGIMDAVANALEQAGTNSTKTTTSP